ncbi:TRAP transporter small permease [Caproicibacter sp.]|uniref:TRAP transporter small permease n=1 Tax=Caproicibacter sp. TaxID=2814884 RepID=UPI0039892608
MEKTKKILDRVFGVVSILCLLGLIFTVLIQIISRTFLPQSPSWTEEVSRFFFISGVLYTTGMAKGANAYVNVDILEQKLNPNAKKAYLVIIDLLVMAFALIFFYESIGFTQSGATFVADTIPLTMNYIYFGTMASGFLMALYTLFDIVFILTDKKEKEGDAK